MTRVIANRASMLLLKVRSICLKNPLFRSLTYDLFEYALESVDSLNEADFMPEIDEFTLKMVSSNEEADEIEALGFEFRSRSPRYRERLDKGAVASCIFVGRELTYIGWVGLTNEAKESMGDPPYRYKVDFANGEACAGSIWTNSKYRGMGLAAYGYFKRLQYLREKGRIVARGATVKDNVATHRMLARFGPRIYAEGRLLRVLWWQFWKEWPVEPKREL
jgi:hypothetical protein